MSTTDSDGTLLRVVVLVLAVLLLVPVLMMVSAVPMMGMMGWGWSGGMMGPGGASPLWGLGMLLVWVLVLGAIGYVVYRTVADGALDGGDRAMEELRVAYARGDLSEEEFERRRDALERPE